MRPFPGDDAPPHGPRSRLVSDSETPLTGFGLPPGPQMTFFFADESTVGSTPPVYPGAHHHPHHPPPPPHRSKENRDKSRSSSGGGSKVPPGTESPEVVHRKVHGSCSGSGSSQQPNSDNNHKDKDKEESNTNCSPITISGQIEKIPNTRTEAAAMHEEEAVSSTQSHSQPQQNQLLQPPPVTPPFRPVSDNTNPNTPVFMGKSGPPSSCALSSVSSRRNSFAGSLSEDLHYLDSQVPPSLDGGDGHSDHDADEGETPGVRGDEFRESSGGSMPASMMMESGSVPQLIMPSIKMPSRRPFTDEGKAMGRLKVMIAGDTGVGKTSLVKAIVQSCEHIVHVDPIGPSSALSGSMTRSMNLNNSRGRNGRSSGSRSSSEVTGTSQITEIYASTKPYPEWWSEIDDFRVLRRRKSLGDSVLDRNICFVDTPGYGSFSSNMDTITPVAQYVETHLHRMNTNALADGDMLNLLGGEGGVQVDVVFYMVSNALRPVDIIYLRQLAPLTNIIILLAQADLMSPEQISTSRERILGQLNEADIRLFSFTMPSPASVTTTGLSMDSSAGKSGVYAISSAAGSDYDIMDASLLMSPDYVQPLMSSELSVLVEQVFSQNGAAWLRHSAARKYVQWRKSGAELSNPHPSPRVSLSPSPTSHRNLSHLGSPSDGLSRLPSEFSLSSRNNSQVRTPAMGATSSYALARLADHTQREERLAQVKLANWAADLQRSLAKERAQYETIARGERAIWLTEKLNECVQDGTLVPVSSAKSGSRSRHRRKSRSKQSGGGGERRGATSPGLWGAWDEYSLSVIEQSGLRGPSPRGNSSSKSPSTSSSQRTRGAHKQQSPEDPLGLLQVAADLRYRSIFALEVLGSLGVLGGLAVWVSRQLFQSQPFERIAVEWERFWS